VGDESALPAIGASLEQVPAGHRVLAVILVDDAAAELALQCPGSLDLTWVHRASEPGADDLLVRTVEKLTFPDGRAQAFVHGEAGEVRSMRRHLLADRGIPKEGSSISPYWRRTLTDEQWRAVKADWLAQTESDV
jgi:NADPH-dependent ferric siderophore reductase